MSIVLAVLALGSVVAGFIGLPQLWREWLGVTAPFYDFLAPVLGHAHLREDVPHGAEGLLMVIAVLVALAGIAFAWLRYGRPGAPVQAGKAHNPLWEVVSNGYYFDRCYDTIVVGGMGWLSARFLPRRIEGPLTRASLEQPARLGERATRLFTRLQTGDLQAYVLYALVGLAVVLILGVARG
jgi:NADH-quinone oxidoreductase subunit L